MTESFWFSMNFQKLSLPERFSKVYTISYVGMGEVLSKPSTLESYDSENQ